jgi:hypothetical protein
VNLTLNLTYIGLCIYFLLFVSEYFIIDLHNVYDFLVNQLPLINPNKKSKVYTYVFILLVVCKDAVCISDYRASNGRIITNCKVERLYDGQVRTTINLD